VAGRLAWSAGALGLAWLTHRLVERPAREGRLAGLPPHRLSALALGATAAVALMRTPP
jgi:peptidoglycan/LPS O-acetylase OafA/YrhL